MKQSCILLCTFAFSAFANANLPSNCSFKSDSFKTPLTNKSVSLKFNNFPERIIAGEAVTLSAAPSTNSVSGMNRTNIVWSSNDGILSSYKQGFLTNVNVNEDNGYHTYWIQQTISGTDELGHWETTFTCDGNPVSQDGYRNCNGTRRQTNTWIVDQRKSYSAQLCAYDELVASYKPSVSIQVNHTDNNVRIDGTVKAEGSQDPYSYNSIQGMPIMFEIQRKYISIFNGNRCDVIEESSNWETIKNLSTSNSFNFNYYSCDVQFRVRSFDGTEFSPWKGKTIVGTYSTGSGSGGSGGSGGTCRGPFCTEEP